MCLSLCKTDFHPSKTSEERERNLFVSFRVIKRKRGQNIVASATFLSITERNAYFPLPSFILMNSLFILLVMFLREKESGALYADAFVMGARKRGCHSDDDCLSLLLFLHRRCLLKMGTVIITIIIAYKKQSALSFSMTSFLRKC